MATTKTWTGLGAAGDVSDLANWNEATAFADGDTYIFDLTDDTIAKCPTTGTITTGAAAIYVTSRSIGSIGDGTNYPTFGNGADAQTLIQIAGKGALYSFACGGSGGVTMLDLRGGNGQVKIYGSNTYAEIRARGFSLLDIGASAVVTKIVNTACPRIKAAAGTAITTYEGFGGGVLDSLRDVTTGRIGDHSVFLKGTAKFATLLQMSHERSRYYKQGSGTDALIEQYAAGSVVTCEGNPSTSATITSLKRVPGAKLVKASGACTLTVTETLIGGDDEADIGIT